MKKNEDVPQTMRHRESPELEIWCLLALTRRLRTKKGSEPKQPVRPENCAGAAPFCGSIKAQIVAQPADSLTLGENDGVQSRSAQCAQKTAQKVLCSMAESKLALVAQPASQRSQLSPAPGPRTAPAIPCLSLGALMALVGAGNAMRRPCSKTAGLYSSGTDSCITGEFR